jgi:hypothetical protein
VSRFLKEQYGTIGPIEIEKIDAQRRQEIAELFIKLREPYAQQSMQTARRSSKWPRKTLELRKSRCQHSHSRTAKSM